MKDRKGLILGVLKVNNKKGVNGFPGPNEEFTDEDLLILEQLSNRVKAMLENMRIREDINNFIKELQNTKVRNLVPKLVVKWAKNLLQADRSELALWDGEQQDLIFVATGSSENKSKSLNKPVPKNGLIREVWNNPKEGFKILPDVEKASKYVAADLQVKSEIALRIEDGGRRIGVLNVESYHSHWFDKQDVSILNILAQHTALSIELIRIEQYFHNLVHDVLENREAIPESVLSKILFGIRESLGFEGGIFYRYQQKDNSLRCISYMGPKTLDQEPVKFSHNLEYPSLAGHVFKTKKPYYSPEPKADPRVSESGLNIFKIDGPILGIPLMFRDEIKGVLTLWSVNNPPPTLNDKNHLEFFARLAASKIAMSQYEQDRDIAQQKLKDSEALYFSLVNNIPLYVFRKDLESRFVSVNESFQKSLNLPLKEIIGKTDYDFYPKSMAKKFIITDKKVIKSRALIDREEEHKIPGMSEPIWVRVIKTPVISANGKVIGVQGIFWNITEEKEIQERYRSLVELSPDSIILHKNGKITLANKASLDLFGVESVQDLEGQPILDFISEESREFSKNRHQRLMLKEEVEQMVEMKIRREDGSNVNVEVYARPSFGEKEVQVVFHDLSRFKTVLRDMHHRVRKSLNETWGMLKLQESATDNEEVKRVFKALKLRIWAMANIHTILFKRDNGRFDIPMNEYITELKNEVLTAHGVSENLVHCNVSISKTLFFDEDKATACGLIVTELMSNSIIHGFNRGEGDIFISLKKASEKDFMLEFSDNGKGFSENHEIPSDSIGLEIVKSLVVNRLKGRISRSSKNRTKYILIFPNN